jgi:cellulose synthase/poly-beta-1,6-N-acetylglucosamine synthase-like glycosyltransferase
MVSELVFWTCLFLVAHTYALYPAFLFVASALVQLARDWAFLRTREDRRVSFPDPGVLPPLSLIVPAHNEERDLPAKLANLSEIDYPQDRLDVIFVSDGSTDGTNRILQEAGKGRSRVIILPTRGGKSSALNCGVAEARHEILILSDAATLFAPDALLKLARHFADPGVGVVCGKLEFQTTPESRQTEGVYWWYESMLRLMESRLGITLTASGAIYAVRRHCFPALPADTLIEDLVIPMHARKLGYRVLYDPEAVAMDFAAPTVAGEFTRRVRVATGSFRALGQLIRTPMDPLTTFAFFSHKVLRWVLPFLLIGLLAASTALWQRPLYRAALIAQLLFYGWAALGFLFRQRVQRIRYALLAYYLLAIHLAFLVGFIRFASGRGEVTWRRVT